jgi:polyhydroxyalkanoate synthesis regulator phasin
MNIDDLQRELLICFSSTDPAVQNAANLTNQYTEMLRAGEISPEEYVEILADIQRSIVISQQMSEMEAKQRLNLVINGLVSVAKLI